MTSKTIMVHCQAFYTPTQNSGGVLWYHVGGPSVCPLCLRPYFLFRKISWVNVKGFSPNLVRALILWRSRLGLLIGKFSQFLTSCLSVFLFPDDNSSKYQWIFTKLDVCIDIVETWFGMADEQISLIFYIIICLRHDMTGYYRFTFYFLIGSQLVSHKKYFTAPGYAKIVFALSVTVLALREGWESETPKNCPGTSKNQCQEVWDSQLLKIFSHL